MICFNLHLQCERESAFSCQHSALCRPHALRRQQGKGEISNEDSATVAASLTVAVVYFFKESFRRG